MIYKDKKGEVLKGLNVFANSFLKEANFKLDTFIKGIIHFKEIVNLEPSIEKELNQLTFRFSFY